MKKNYEEFKRLDDQRQQGLRLIPRAVLGSEVSLHHCLKKCHQLLRTSRLLHLSLLWNSDNLKHIDIKSKTGCLPRCLRFLAPISLSESESEPCFGLVFCLMKSSSLSLPFTDSERQNHNRWQNRDIFSRNSFYCKCSIRQTMITLCIKM